MIGASVMSSQELREQSLTTGAHPSCSDLPLTDPHAQTSLMREAPGVTISFPIRCTYFARQVGVESIRQHCLGHDGIRFGYRTISEELNVERP